MLKKNPLEDIRNSNSVVYTIINRRVYDAATLNETGNYDTMRSKFYWELNNYNQNFKWHEETQGFGHHQCSCFGF